MSRDTGNAYEGMTQVHNAYSYPTKPHYAVIFFTTKTVYEQDYYPEEHGGSQPTRNDINSFEYWYTEDVNIWQKYIELLYLGNPSRSDISAFQVSNTAQIDKTIKIKFAK